MECKFETEVALPPIGLKVIAQCNGFRCMAYRNIDGKWMAAFDNRELEGVVSFRLMSGSTGQPAVTLVPFLPIGWAAAV